MTKKNAFYWVISQIAVIVAFSVLSFMWAKNYTVSFWLGFFIVVGAWTLLLIATILTAKEQSQHKDEVFVNAPILLLALFHFILQTLSGISTMAFSWYSVKLSCTISFLLFAVFWVLAVALAYYKKKTNSGMADRSLHRAFIERFRSGLKELELRCADPGTRSLVHEVSEAAKYANPNSSALSANDEVQLLELLDSLKNAVADRNRMLIEAICEEMIIQIKKRDLI